MSFSDIINNILGNDWVQAIINILGTTATGIIIGLWVRLKNKLLERDNGAAKTISEFKKAYKELSDFNKEMAVSYKALQDQNQKLVEGLAAVGNVVSIAFLNTKAIDAETKIKISGAVSVLSNLGVDMQAANAVVDSLNAAAEVAVATVEKIKEEQQVVSDESSEKAADTEAKSYDIYNQILADE